MVSQRTAELQDANERLTSEIVERTQAEREFAVFPRNVSHKSVSLQPNSDVDSIHRRAPLPGHQ